MRTAFHWLTHPAHLTPLLLSAALVALVVGFQNAHAANFPRGDQFRTVRNAVAAHDGTLTLADLFEPEDGHVQFFTRLQTAVVTWLTGWNLNVEMRVNLVLAGVVWGLLALLFARTHPGHVSVALVPFALWVFSLNQDFMWVVGFSSCWFYTNAFLLAALNLVAYRPERPLPFALAALCAAAATFSFGNGLLAWVVVGLALPFAGFRNWRYYAAWGGVGALAIGAFLAVSGIEAGGESASTGFTLTPAALQTAARFTLTFVGGILTTDSVRQADAAALWGVGFALANLAYLAATSWHDANTRRLVGVWAALALFPVASGFLAGLSRPNWYQTGAETALQTQYKTGAALFWAALAAVMIAAGVHLLARGGWWRRLLLAANLTFAAALALAYVVANYGSVAAPWHWSHNIKYQTEDCFVRALYVQDPTLTPDANCWSTRYANDLAPRRLALFADATPAMILPSYQPGTPVLVGGVDATAAQHTADWLLAEVPADALHILPAGATAPTFTTAGVWAVRWAGAPPLPPPAGAGYAALDMTHEIDAGLTFALTLYQRLPDADTPTAQLGDHIRLVDATRFPAEAAACDTINVTTFWQTTTPNPTAVPYSMTLTLATPDGTPVARADAQLTLVPSDTWTPNATYPDARTLALPCDLPAGDYPLAVGVYDWRDGVRVPTTPPGAAAPSGDLLTLGTVRLRPAANPTNGE